MITCSNVKNKQLFIMDPLGEIDPGHDTTYVIMREIESRGGKIWWARSQDICLTTNKSTVVAEQVTLSETGGDEYYSPVGQAELPLDNFELCWMREDPPFDREYLYATYLLERAPVPVINQPEGIRNSNEKLFILEFPELIPRTWVGASPEKAFDFIEALGGEAVLKTLSGYGGEEVYHLEANSKNSKELLRKFSRDGSRPLMVQEFLPAVREQGDRRIIVINGEPVGGLTRYPKEGDFRANLHSGGAAGEVYVSKREKEICERLKPVLRDRGLYLVGLDLVEDKITEINVTSPTCVQEINRAASTKLEQKIVDFAESLVN